MENSTKNSTIAADSNTPDSQFWDQFGYSLKLPGHAPGSEESWGRPSSAAVLGPVRDYFDAVLRYKPSAEWRVAAYGLREVPPEGVGVAAGHPMIAAIRADNDLSSGCPPGPVKAGLEAVLSELEVGGCI